MSIWWAGVGSYDWKVEINSHANVSTTQIYTQVSIRKLQAVHAATHPSAKLNRPGVAKAKPPEEPALSLKQVMTELELEVANDGD